MGLLDHLAVLLAGSDAPNDPPAETSFYECRHCGTTVDSPEEVCPACGEAEIAEYVLE